MKWSALMLGLVLWGCGGDDDKDDPVIEYASMTVDASADDEDGEYPLTGLLACNLDSNSGLFTASFSGTDGSQLNIDIKGFSSTGKSYTCTQVEANTSGPIDSKFDDCGITFKVPAATTGINTYGMYRVSADVKDFTYGGTCSVTIEYTKPRVSGDIQCTNLIQTHFEGQIRNPIDTSITASLSTGTKFYCDHS